MSITKDDVIRTFWNATPAVREIMLTQAQLHAQSRLQTSTAMEQRVTAVAALLLAAAAVAAQIAWQVQAGVIAGLSGCGAVAFAVGGVIAIGGVRAGSLAPPGADPAWWAKCEAAITGFNADQANGWVIAHAFDVIKSLDEMATRRAEAMNLALRYGAAGSGLLAMSAILAVFR